MLLWPDVRFDDAEYDSRLARLRVALAGAGLDAVVISDERTTWYLTGFGAREPIGSTARPRVVVVAREPEVATQFFVHESTSRCVREMAAPGVEVVSYSELGAPVRDLSALLITLGVHNVGAELGGGMQPRLGPIDVRGIEAAAKLELVDASALLWCLRGSKSSAEIDRIRRACAITAEAYELAFARIRVGMTEAAVAGIMHDALIKCGAEGAFVNCVTGRGQYDRVDGVPRERVIEKGELIFLDAGAAVGGYWSDYSRSGVLGGPTSEQELQQERVHRVTLAGAEAMRPGVSMRRVAEIVDAAMNNEDIEFNNRPGRYGHSIGMSVTEPPDVALHDESILRPGMVMTIEPATLDNDGIYHCEENLIVTDDCPETLSLSDWRLRALG